MQLQRLTCVLICLLALTNISNAQQSPLKVSKDTVRIENAELIIENATRQQPGFLYNNKNGRTSFSGIGKMVQFKAGDAGFPAVGESTYTDSAFLKKHIRVWRNGLLQYRDYVQGIMVDQTTGTISFYPALAANDRIYIEVLNGVETNEDQGGGDGTSNLKNLYAGAFNNGDNSFVLRWATNHTTLYSSPRVAGLGSSTLAGYGLAYPNRLGDRISAWLAASTLSSAWVNYGVSGFRSIDVQKTSEGGVPGHNIETAFSFNPDFILIILPTNDAGSGITSAQSMINLRKLDTMAQNRGIPLFIETAQPRTSYSVNEQSILKTTADSIRNGWPDRYIEGFIGFNDPNSGTPAALLPSYDNGDQTHLNPEGIQHLSRNIFSRLAAYFQPITGVTRYVIDSSSNGINWTQFDVVANGNIVKKKYTIPRNGVVYFRVRAEKADGITLQSNITALKPVDNGGTDNFDHRVLVDLGGDGVNTLNGTRIDGKPTPSPDANDNYWNNWYGIGGVTGFVDNAQSGYLTSTANKATPIRIKLIGKPEGTFGSSATKSLNFNGFNNTGIGDYPMEAIYDNVYFHNSINPNGVTFRVYGLSKTNIYTFKLWGARIDTVSNAALRMLQSKLGHQLWTDALQCETMYPKNALPQYNNANVHAGITGVDSIDINVRVGNNSQVAHISLIDIGIKGTLPPAPYVEVRDTSISLPQDSVFLKPFIQANGIAITGYKWEKLSGPNDVFLANPYGDTTTIKELTNGKFVFRFTAITESNMEVSDVVTVSVFPNNNGKKTMRVNFSATPMPEVPGWVNAAGSPSKARIIVQDPVTNWIVDNVDNNPIYWTEFTGFSASDVDGKSTGNNSGAVPDIVLRSYWFNYSRTYNNLHNLEIKGLNPSKTYTIGLIASRGSHNTTGPKSGVWRINGISPPIYQDAMDYIKPIREVTATPDANGRIYIDVYPSDAVYGSFSYINALIVQEN